MGNTESVPGCERDYRWILLVVLSLVITFNAYGGRTGQSDSKRPPAKITPRAWCEMDLVWDVTGQFGAGVYSGLHPTNQGNVEHFARDAGVSPLVSPRLAVFTFRQFDLNQVDVDTLQIVKGIGPKLAVAIVDYRLTHGPFHALDELLAVKGIGPTKLTLLRGYLMLSPPQR